MSTKSYYIMRSTTLAPFVTHTSKLNGRPHHVTTTLEDRVIKEVAARNGWEYFYVASLDNKSIQLFTLEEAEKRMEYYFLRRHKNEKFEICKRS